MLADNKLVAQLVGDSDTLKIGEYMWIGGAHTADREVIIATSTRASHSLVTPYNIQILKLIEERDGFKLFKYGTDIASLRTSIGSPIESLIF